MTPILSKASFSILFLLFVFSTEIHSAPYSLEVAFPQLVFKEPVDLQACRDGSHRLFVVEQEGVIRSFANQKDTNVSQVFLDVRERVNRSGGEEGLLGLAFHPKFKENGYFFVNYTAKNPRRTVIERFQQDPKDRTKIDKRGMVILEFDQPYSNHNGGQLAFGPDGFLYIGTGDGGSGGDPHGNGQNRNTLLGKMLRIDVDKPEGRRSYAIPKDNPYYAKGFGYREEIFAYGLRNPWRYSFDSETGRLWVADVGQNKFEEVNLVEKGKNYGWNIMEGNHCFKPSAGCKKDGLTLPIVEYDHNLGRSVTGGYVYRGKRLPNLVGSYIYSDFVTGRIWSLRPQRESFVNQEILASELNVSSFGVDEHRELYILSYYEGKIYQLK